MIAHYLKLLMFNCADYPSIFINAKLWFFVSGLSKIRLILNSRSTGRLIMIYGGI